MAPQHAHEVMMHACVLLTVLPFAKPLQVMEAYQQMVASGCERTVITYSSLISACEKDGKWEMAMSIYQQMLQDG